MHGLPKDTDLRALREEKLTAVIVRQFQLVICLGEAVSVSTSADVVFIEAAGPPICYEDTREAAVPLISRIGSSVVKAQASGDGALLVLFDDGSCATFLDSEKNYESYQIHIGDDVIAV